VKCLPALVAMTGAIGRWRVPGALSPGLRASNQVAVSAVGRAPRARLISRLFHRALDAEAKALCVDLAAVDETPANAEGAEARTLARAR
jgi:hypothetical protein